MNSNSQPKIVSNKDKKKKFKYNPEITFKSKEHLQAYLIDKIATNKNRKFNMRLKV